MLTSQYHHRIDTTFSQRRHWRFGTGSWIPALNRRLRHLAFKLSLIAWLGFIAVPAVNAQGGDKGVWIRVCLGTGTSWTQLSLDDNEHRPAQNNHCPCTQNTLDTAWHPIVKTRPPQAEVAPSVFLTVAPKPPQVLPYFSRAPPLLTANA
ncbi:hypothetical protein [Saccharospirillum mangrovi]|uniref:hypothetical protein n=1 Tax=Saccharospirillum mangrovi TaxID=2161747 RepID=UPI001300716B|nr:hypothetical protein [Saccharospirillum mangrovi]